MNVKNATKTVKDLLVHSCESHCDPVVKKKKFVLLLLLVCFFVCAFFSMYWIRIVFFDHPHLLPLFLKVKRWLFFRNLFHANRSQFNRIWLFNFCLTLYENWIFTCIFCVCAIRGVLFVWVSFYFSPEIFLKKKKIGKKSSSMCIVDS